MDGQNGDQVKGKLSDIQGEDHTPCDHLKMTVFLFLLTGMPFMLGN